MTQGHCWKTLLQKCKLGSLLEYLVATVGTEVIVGIRCCTSENRSLLTYIVASVKWGRWNTLLKLGTKIIVGAHCCNIEPMSLLEHIVTIQTGAIVGLHCCNNGLITLFQQCPQIPFVIPLVAMLMSVPMMWLEECLWSLSVLQRVHLSNPVPYFSMRRAEGHSHSPVHHTC
jgi:hypothetical protein